MWDVFIEDMDCFLGVVVFFLFYVMIVSVNINKVDNMVYLILKVLKCYYI